MKSDAEGIICLVCRACNKTNRWKSWRSRDDRNPIVEGKGVLSNQESEGSSRQTFDMTDRNLIQGSSLRVIDLWIKKPKVVRKREGVNQAYRMESVITYPGRFWNRFGFL